MLRVGTELCSDVKRMGNVIGKVRSLLLQLGNARPTCTHDPVVAERIAVPAPQVLRPRLRGQFILWGYGRTHFIELRRLPSTVFWNRSHWVLPRDETNQKTNSTLVYGEITFNTLAVVLHKIKTVYGRRGVGHSGPQGVLQEPGGAFYDIGAGTGKPVRTLSDEGATRVVCRVSRYSPRV